MSSATPLIHIGYQKTGSTWLQNQVFNQAALGLRQPFSIDFLKSALVLPAPFHFDAESCRSRFECELAREDCPTIPIISLERLSGQFYQNGWDAKEFADRLYRVFPEARILLVIREQRSMLASSYKHYLRSGGGVLSLEAFFNGVSDGERRPVFHPERYEYHCLIQYYQQLFGTEQVLVLPYEQLVQDARGYVQAILDYNHIQWADTALDTLTVERFFNRGLSATAASLKRKLNRLCVYDQTLNPAPLLPVHIDNRRIQWLVKGIDARLPEFLKTGPDRRLAERVSAFADQRYRHSNAITSELIGVDLGVYGYDL